MWTSIWADAQKCDPGTGVVQDFEQTWDAHGLKLNRVLIEARGKVTENRNLATRPTAIGRCAAGSDRIMTRSSGNHLGDDELSALSRAGSLSPGQAPAGSSPARHLAGCRRCQNRAAALRALARAARAADRALTGPIEVPTFDALIGARLPRPAPASPALPAAIQTAPKETAAARYGSLGHRVRLALRVVGYQARLLPRSLAPITGFGFVTALVAALSTHDPTWGVRLFGVMVTLLLLVGAMAVCQPRRDPRRELLYALPVSPGAVFLARLTLVLSLGLGAALAGSIAVGAAGHRAGVTELILQWLGPSLLSSSVAVVLAVWVPRGSALRRASPCGSPAP